MRIKQGIGKEKKICESTKIGVSEGERRNVWMQVRHESIKQRKVISRMDVSLKDPFTGMVRVYGT
jgi:hypothetical protein